MGGPYRWNIEGGDLFEMGTVSEFFYKQLHFRPTFVATTYSPDRNSKGGVNFRNFDSLPAISIYYNPMTFCFHSYSRTNSESSLTVNSQLFTVKYFIVLHRY